MIHIWLPLHYCISLYYRWAYIKEHKLQDPTRKTVIRCDENLKAVLGKAEINQTELLRLVQPHIEKLEGDKPAAPKTKPKLQ